MRPCVGASGETFLRLAAPVGFLSFHHSSHRTLLHRDYCDEVSSYVGWPALWEIARPHLAYFLCGAFIA